MGFLRGPADRERQTGHPSRLGPALQGPLPTVPHDAGQARGPQGRVGLPRPARRGRGREGARVLGQVRDRGLRHRALQRQVPGLGAALRRGLAVADLAHRHVDRHRRRVLDALERVHRERLVAVPPDLGRGRDLRGLQGRAVLRPVRYRIVEPRARPTGRVPRRHRAVGLRPLPARGPRRRPAGVDDHTVDAAVERRRRRRLRRSTTYSVRAPEGGRDLVMARARVADVLGADAEIVADVPTRGTRRRALRTTVHDARGRGRERVHRRRRRLRHDRGRFGHRAPRAHVRRDRPRDRRTRGIADRQSRQRRGPLRTRYRRAVRGPVRQGHRSRPHRRPHRRGKIVAVVDYTHSYPHCWRCDTPLIYWAKPTWFARTSAHKARAARRERDHQLVPGAHQARSLRRLAREQRRLGAVTRSLLGHSHPGVALPRLRSRHVHRVGRRTRATRGPRPRRDGSAPPVRRRRDDHVPGVQDRHRVSHPTRARRVVRLRFDARRAVPLSVRRTPTRSSTGSPPTSSAKPSTRPAGGSTPCSR